MPLPDDTELPEQTAADNNTTAAEPAPDLSVGELTAAPQPPPSWQDVKSDPNFKAQPPEKQLIVQDRWAKAARAYGETLPDWADTQAKFDEGVARQRDVFSKAAGGLTPDQARVKAAQSIVDKASKEGRALPNDAAALPLFANAPDLYTAWKDRRNDEGSIHSFLRGAQEFDSNLVKSALGTIDASILGAAKGVTRFVNPDIGTKEDWEKDGQLGYGTASAIHDKIKGWGDFLAAWQDEVPKGFDQGKASTKIGEFAGGLAPYFAALPAAVAVGAGDAYGTTFDKTGGDKTKAVDAAALSVVGNLAFMHLAEVTSAVGKGIANPLARWATSVAAGTAGNVTVQQILKAGEAAIQAPAGQEYDEFKKAFSDIKWSDVGIQSAFAASATRHAEQARTKEIKQLREDRAVVNGTHPELQTYQNIIESPEHPPEVKALAQQHIDTMLSGAESRLKAAGEALPQVVAPNTEAVAAQAEAAGSHKVAEALREQATSPEEAPVAPVDNSRVAAIDQQLGKLRDELGPANVDRPETEIEGKLQQEKADILAGKAPKPTPVILEPKVESATAPDGSETHQLDIPEDATPEEIQTLKETVASMPNLPPEVKDHFDKTLAEAADKAAGVPTPKTTGDGREVYTPETPEEVTAVEAKLKAGGYTNVAKISVGGKTTIWGRPAGSEAPAKEPIAAPAKPEGPTPGTYDSVKANGLSKDEQLSIDAVKAGTKPLVLSSTRQFQKRAKAAGLQVIERILPGGTKEHVAFKDQAAFDAYKATDGLTGEAKWTALGKAFGYTDAEIASFLERRKASDAAKASDAEKVSTPETTHDSLFPNEETTPATVADHVANSGESTASAAEHIERFVQERSAALQPAGDVGEGTGDKVRGTESESAKSVQESGLLDWAKKTGHELTLDDLRKITAARLERGTEHQVWMGEDGKSVVKITDAGEYGHHEGALDYLRNIALGNRLFNMNVEVLGVINTEAGPHIVTKHTFVKGTIPSGDEIAAWMKREGFEPRAGGKTAEDYKMSQLRGGDIDSWVRASDGVELHDTGPDNFVKTPEGEIVPVDVLIEHTPEGKEARNLVHVDDIPVGLGEAQGQAIAARLGIEFAGVQKGITKDGITLPGHLSFHVPLGEGKFDNVVLNEGDTIATLKEKLTASEERRRAAAAERRRATVDPVRQVEQEVMAAETERLRKQEEDRAAGIVPFEAPQSDNDQRQDADHAEEVRMREEARKLLAARSPEEIAYMKKIAAGGDDSVGDQLHEDLAELGYEYDGNGEIFDIRAGVAEAGKDAVLPSEGRRLVRDNKELPLEVLHKIQEINSHDATLAALEDLPAPEEPATNVVPFTQPEPVENTAPIKPPELSAEEIAKRKAAGEREELVSVALKTKDGNVYTQPIETSTHGDVLDRIPFRDDEGNELVNDDGGFVTNFGRYVLRREAAEIAKANGKKVSGLMEATVYHPEPVIKGELRREIPAKPPVVAPEVPTKGGPVEPLRTEGVEPVAPVAEQEPLSKVVTGDTTPLPAAKEAAAATTAAKGKGSTLAASAEGPQTHEQITAKAKETGVVPSLSEVAAMVTGKANPTFLDYQDGKVKALWEQLKRDAAAAYPAEAVPEGAAEDAKSTDKSGHSQDTLGNHPVTGVHMPTITEPTLDAEGNPVLDKKGNPVLTVRAKYTGNPEVTAAQLDTGQRVVIPDEIASSQIPPSIRWTTDPNTGERYVISAETPLGVFTTPDAGDRSKRDQAEPTYSQANRDLLAFNQAQQTVSTDKIENLGESTAPVNEDLLKEDEARAKTDKAEEDFNDDTLEGHQNDGTEREDTTSITQAAADELEHLGLNPAELATEDTESLDRQFTAARRTPLQERIFQELERYASRTPEQVRADDARVAKLERESLEEAARDAGMDEEYIPQSTNKDLREYVKTTAAGGEEPIAPTVEQTSHGGWFLPDGKFLRMGAGTNYMHKGKQLGEHWPLISRYLKEFNPKLLAKVEKALQKHWQSNDQPEIDALTRVLAREGFTRAASDGETVFLDGALSKAHRDAALEYAIANKMRLEQEVPGSHRTKILYDPEDSQTEQSVTTPAVDAKALTNYNFAHLAEMGMLTAPKKGSKWRYALDPKALDNFLTFARDKRLRVENSEIVQTIFDQFRNAIESGKVDLELVNMPNANWAADHRSLGNGRSRLRINISADHEGGVAGTLIHELAHHVTAVKLDPNYVGNTVERKAVANLHKLFDYTARKEYESQFGHAPTDQDLDTFQLLQRGDLGNGQASSRGELVGVSRNYYGFHNIAEFVAETLSNPRFQRILSAIDGHPDFTPAKGKIRTLLSNIHDVLARLFTGTEVKPDSALSDALREALGLANTPIRPEAIPGYNERYVPMEEQAKAQGHGSVEEFEKNDPAGFAKAYDKLVAPTDASIPRNPAALTQAEQLRQQVVAQAVKDGDKLGELRKTQRVPHYLDYGSNLHKVWEEAKLFGSGHANREYLAAWLNSAKTQAQLFTNRKVNDVRDSLKENFGRTARRLDYLQKKLGTEYGKEYTTTDKADEKALSFVVESQGNRAALEIMRVKIDRALKQFGDQRSEKWRKMAKQSLVAIEHADNNWDQLSKVADVYNKIMGGQLTLEHLNGLKTPFRQGYVPHVQDLSEDFLGLFGTPTSGAGTSFRNQRQFNTFADSIEAGHAPKSINAVELMEHRLMKGNNVLTTHQWATRGKGLIDPTTKLPLMTDTVIATHPKSGEKRSVAPDGYTLRELGGHPIAVHENYAGLFDSLTSASTLRASAAGRLALKTEGAIKHGLLLFDSFHLGRLAYYQIPLRGKFTYNKGLLTTDYTNEALKNMERRGELPKGITAGDLIKRKDDLNSLVQQGYNVGGITEALNAGVIKNIPGISSFNKFVFKEFQRGGMVESGLGELERQRQVYPELSETQLARKVAKELNTRFGNLQKEGWFKSDTFRDLAQLSFLAPSWNEGLLKSEVGFAKQFAQTAGGAIANPSRFAKDAMNLRLRQGALMKSSGTLLLGTFLANQLINYITRGQPTWENKEEGISSKLSAYIPDKISGGPGYFLNPLTLPAELTHQVLEAHERGASALGSLAQVIGYKLAPVNRAALTAFTRTDRFGRKLGSDWDIAKEMISEVNPLPISAGAAYAAVKRPFTGKLEEVSKGATEKQVFSSAGIKLSNVPSAAGRIYNLAKEFAAEQGVPPSPAYATAVYSDLNQALRAGNTTAAKKAFALLLTTHTKRALREHYDSQVNHPFTGVKKLEHAFRQSLTPEQLDRYKEAVQERRDIKKAYLKMAQEYALENPTAQ